MSGYYEIGIFHTKTEQNVGTLWRSAYQLGASGVFTIGRRYKRQSSDTLNVMNNIPLRHYDTFDDFKSNRPVGAVLVGVEMGGTPLSQFEHPRNAIYLLGAEDHGLPPEIMEYCNKIVSLESIGPLSYNVAVTGSIVLYSRAFFQRSNTGCTRQGVGSGKAAFSIPEIYPVIEGESALTPCG